MFSFIAAEKTNYPVAVMCRVLEVNRTGFHDWERRAPSDRALADAWLPRRSSRSTTQAAASMARRGSTPSCGWSTTIRVGRKRVERLMAAAGISGVMPRKRWRTTIRVPGDHARPTTSSSGSFEPDAPNVLWLADITYLRTWEGWLYLAAVQDAYSRRIVGWSMADHMRASSSSTRCRWRCIVAGPTPG